MVHIHFNKTYNMFPSEMDFSRTASPRFILGEEKNPENTQKKIRDCGIDRSIINKHAIFKSEFQFLKCLYTL